MKLALILICFLIAMVPLARAAETQVFSTSAGPVKITPLYHASTLIEAGGKIIYLDPAKPAKLSGLPKADLILITDIHGDHMDPAAIAPHRHHMDRLVDHRYTRLRVRQRNAAHHTPASS